DRESHRGAGARVPCPVSQENARAPQDSVRCGFRQVPARHRSPAWRLHSSASRSSAVSRVATDGGECVPRCRAGLLLRGQGRRAWRSGNGLSERAGCPALLNFGLLVGDAPGESNGLMLPMSARDGATMTERFVLAINDHPIALMAMRILLSQLD